MESSWVIRSSFCDYHVYRCFSLEIPVDDALMDPREAGLVLYGWLSDDRTHDTLLDIFHFLFDPGILATLPRPPVPLLVVGERLRRAFLLEELVLVRVPLPSMAPLPVLPPTPPTPPVRPPPTIPPGRVPPKTKPPEKPKLRLRIQIHDRAYVPCAGTPCTIKLPSGQIVQKTSDGSGWVVVEIEEEVSGEAEVVYRAPQDLFDLQLAVTIPRRAVDDARCLQEIVNLGLGAQTEALTLRRFQEAAGLPLTGTLDDDTRRVLGEIRRGAALIPILRRSNG